MNVHTIVGHVFGKFQNLNLIFLLEDLRRGRIARGNWSNDRWLCPVAHGVTDGDTVRLLSYASQAVDVNRACRIAAENLHTSAFAVQQFVNLWDSAWFDGDWLLQQIEWIWSERRADAEVVQAVIAPNRNSDGEKMAGVYGNRTHLGPDFQTLRRV